MHISFVPTEAALSNPRVLLIEEDAALASCLLDGMTKAGLIAMCAGTGTQGLALKDSFKPHVILMDLTLCDMSGVTLLSHLAGRRDCGLIVLSDLDDETDRIMGLELGADDYVLKPPRLRELIARIRAVHRRVNLRAQPQTVSETPPVMKIGPIRISSLHRTVHTEDGRRLALTSAEFSTLEMLAGAAGATVSRDKLTVAAFRRPWHAEDRGVDQLVFNLRRKLPADKGGGMLIHSIRGCGYWMRAPESMTRQSTTLA